MEYIELIDFLNNATLFGVKSGLNNMKVLMKKLNSPEEKLKVIHVAGTNGKGSVCAMLSNILINANYKVGMFTSPHLIKYNERIVINGIEISDNEFADIGDRVKEKIHEMKEEGYNQPTFFEIITAIAFLYFYEQNVDIAIIEVGLGGRLDATNIIKNPLISVITSIGYDHINILGDTIEKITSEKAGIIKENCPVVLSDNVEKVYNVVKEYCRKNNSRLYYSHNYNIHILKNNFNGMNFSITSQYYTYNNIFLNLLGDHQIINAATVLLTIKVLKDNYLYVVKDEDIYNGLKNVVWSGRMELIGGQQTMLLDGAHNINGVMALISFLKNMNNSNNITLILSILRDKSYKSIINMFYNVNNINKIIFVQLENKRALTIEDFSKLGFYKNKDTYFCSNVNKALKLAKMITNKEDIILCSGSLYLVGDIKKILKEEI